jgi:hypothetical protein
MVQGDSGVGVDNVVILSYRMAKMRGGRLRYISLGLSIKTARH